MIRTLFSRLSGQGAPGLPAKGSASLPRLDLQGGPVYAVGDVHGCRTLLAQMEDIIRQDAVPLGGRARIVLLGDFIDRGPDTSGLMDDLTLPLPWAERLAIRGNHEEMMLNFLDQPKLHVGWLGCGGFETLASYGLIFDRAAFIGTSAARLREMLEAHLPESHVEYLRKLPAGFVARGAGDHFVLAHAGYDFARPADGQNTRTLVWGPARGLSSPNEGGTKLVHGHLISNAPDLDARCINLDLGAYRTGRLAALRLVHDAPPALLMTADAGP